MSGTAGSQNYLYGYDGEDSLQAGNGGDALYGGNDSDTLRGGSGDDVFHGGSGADLLDLSSGGDDRIDLGVIAGSDSDPGASDTVNGFGADDLITITASGIITFAASADTTRATNVISVDLNGSNSADTGDLELTFDNQGNASTAASRIAYALTGTTGHNTISGGGLDDRLDGSAGDDSLTGGAGKDWLKGATGQDTLIGGADADTFAFEAGDSTDNTSTCDSIIGLSIGDKIEMSVIDFNYNFNAGAFSGSTAQASDMAFTDVFDCFVYSDGGASYFVWEVTPGSGATAGSLEMVTIGATIPGTLSGWTQEYGVITVA